MVTVVEYLYLLAVPVLIGKVVLLSFVIAPILATTLERESFGAVVRRLFPAYYALGMAAAAMGVVSVLVQGSFRIRVRCDTLQPASGWRSWLPRPTADRRSRLGAMP